MLAGQPVGELMNRGDHEDGQPGQKERLPTIEAVKVPLNVFPVGDGIADGKQNDGARGDQETWREEESKLADQTAGRDRRLSVANVECFLESSGLAGLDGRYPEPFRRATLPSQVARQTFPATPIQ